MINFFFLRMEGSQELTCRGKRAFLCLRSGSLVVMLLEVAEVPASASESVSEPHIDLFSSDRCKFCDLKQAESLLLSSFFSLTSALCG